MSHAKPCHAVLCQLLGPGAALPGCQEAACRWGGVFFFFFLDKENVFLFPLMKGGRGSGSVQRVQQLLDRIRCHAFKDSPVPRLSPRAPALRGRAAVRCLWLSQPGLRK